MLYILIDKTITWSIAQVHINGVNSFDVRRRLILLVKFLVKIDFK